MSAFRDTRWLLSRFDFAAGASHLAQHCVDELQGVLGRLTPREPNTSRTGARSRLAADFCRADASHQALTPAALAAAVLTSAAMDERLLQTTWLLMTSNDVR